MLKPVLAVALLLSLALAGCSGGDKEGDPTGTQTGTGSRTGTTTSAGGNSTAANRAPTATLNVSVANGTSPLDVAFSVSGSDPDGDALTWTLAFGDGNSTNGTALPSNATHSYGMGGNFTAVLTVSDGEASATSNVTIAVAAASIPDPLHFEGTLTAIPYIPQVGSPNDLVEEASATHDFAFTGNPSKMTVTLVYEADPTELINDVDLYVTDPSGEETASEAAGPEPPMEISSPAPGQWSVRVFAYGGTGEVPYTVDIVFS